MCGIVGYVGPRAATPILVDGLRKLEYRGYDSAGLAVHDGKTIEVVRAVGKLAHLDEALAKHPLSGTTGIGHTRWATHGRPSEHNAHPHSAGDVAVVHNGIIENHVALRTALQQVEGAYAIAVVSRSAPDRLVVAKSASPLVLGIGNGETLCGSDIPALLSHTRDVI